MLDGKKLICDCCGKQIINQAPRNDRYVTSTPFTYLGVNQHSCKYCSENLDEYGLFPEERH